MNKPPTSRDSLKLKAFKLIACFALMALFSSWLLQMLDAYVSDSIKTIDTLKTSGMLKISSSYFLASVVALFKSFPGWLFSFGFGIFVAWNLRDEIRNYTNEVIAQALGQRKILEMFSLESRREFISTVLELHAPDCAQKAIINQIESARLNLSLRRKNAKAYKLLIEDFPPIATTASSADANANSLIQNRADYFRFEFAETYDLKLTAKDCEQEFFQWFTVHKEKLPAFFKQNFCIYRDLLLLSPADAKKQLDSYGGDEIVYEKGKQHPYVGLVSAELQIKVPGFSDTHTIQYSMIRVDSDGIRFSFSLKDLPNLVHLLENEDVVCKMVNTVVFPVWKEVRGYPLIFMSYSEAPVISLFVKSDAIKENSFTPFLSCIDSSGYELTKGGGDSANPATQEIRVQAGQWVLPFSGVYVTWSLADRDKPIAKVIASS